MPQMIEKRRAYAANRIGYNRGRFELASEIESMISLADTVDADKLREILWPELGGIEAGRNERNSHDLDTRLVPPDYVVERMKQAIEGDG